MKLIKKIIRVVFGIKVTTNKKRMWDKRGNKWHSYTDQPRIIYLADYGYSFNYYHYNDLKVRIYENNNG